MGWGDVDVGRDGRREGWIVVTEMREGRVYGRADGQTEMKKSPSGTSSLREDLSKIY